MRDRVRAVAAIDGLNLEQLAADVVEQALAERAGPPRAVVLIEQLAAVQLAGQPAAPHAEVELADVRRRISTLRAQIAGLEQAGYTLEELEDHRLELATCENRLRQLEEGRCASASAG
jgi:hypothetical protein